MLTPEELQAEIEARLEANARIRLSREALEPSAEARNGKMSPLDDAFRRLGVHPMAVATSF